MYTYGMKNEVYNKRKTRLRYHVVFSTKYRKKCLKAIEQEVISSFKEAEKTSAFRLLNIGVDEEHVHFLVKFKPHFSIEQIIRRMKQLSTKYLWDAQENHLRKFYWGKKQLLWTRGYFVSTIGEVSENKVMEYIENQG